VNNIDWLAMYCIYYKHNFGHIILKHPMNVPEAKYEIMDLPEPCGEGRIVGTFSVVIILATVVSLFSIF
jgi:hypothetical protein